MSKYAKITLLTLVAFVLFGFSSTIYAAKTAKGQVITSAPIIGPSNTCSLTNVSGRGINAVITIYSFNNDPVTENKEVLIGGWAYTVLSYGTSNDIAYCEIRWAGEPDDFRASFCVYQTNTWATYPNVCLELH